MAWATLQVLKDMSDIGKLWKWLSWTGGPGCLQPCICFAQVHRQFSTSFLHSLVPVSRTVILNGVIQINNSHNSWLDRISWPIPNHSSLCVCLVGFSFASNKRANRLTKGPVASLFILSFCWGADYFRAKPLFITIAASMGTVFFIVVTCVTTHMVQYVFLILAFGCVYALPPLVSSN